MSSPSNRISVASRRSRRSSSPNVVDIPVTHHGWSLLNRIQFGKPLTSLSHNASITDTILHRVKCCDRKGRRHNNLVKKVSIFSYATASESRWDHAADPKWHKRRLPELPPQYRFRTGIASTAFDGIKVAWMNTRKKNQTVKIGED